MPTIKKLDPKPKSTFHNDTPIRELRQKAYNSSAWRKARLFHIKHEPLCQECLRNGIVKPADHVHHIKSPFKGGKIDWELLLDDSNLESICAECHGKEHSKWENPEDVISQLDALLNNEEKNTKDDD